MENKLAQLFTFPTADTKNGILAMFQVPEQSGKQHVPFDIVRVLVMKDIKVGDVRGGHTHHTTKQMLFVLEGSCIVDLDNGKEKASVVLDTFHTGLYLPPYVWHVMRDFTPGSILLVLADSEYDEKEYIRDYQEFLTFVS